MAVRGRWAMPVVAVVLIGIPALAPLPALDTARLSWFASVVFCTATQFGARTTVRLLGPDDPARRFWRAMRVNSLLVGGGYLLTLVASVRSAELLPGPVAQALIGLGALIVVVVMLTYPLPMHSGRERFCFWLDVATVMVGAAALGWYISDPGTDLGSGALAVLTGPVVMLVAVFAVAKLLIAGRPPFSTWPGLIGAGAAVVATGLAVAGPALAARSTGAYFGLSALGDALIAAAAWLQSTQIERRPHLLERRRRRYSTLPYAAVAGTFVLLWVALLDTGLRGRTWAVLAGAACSVGLVLIRQLASFAENARLLDELDRKVTELHRTEAGLRAAIEERDTLAAKLREMAFHDGLTGLPNRSLFHDRLHRALAAGDAVAVLYLDLDDFKPINDRYGHLAGDEVLRQVGRRLTGCVRPGDTVSRLGGDEFAVLLPGSLPAEVALVADRIGTAIREPYSYDGATLRIGVSIGTATRPDGGTDADQLLNRADLAMYQAKKDGKRVSPAAPPGR